MGLNFPNIDAASPFAMFFRKGHEFSRTYPQAGNGLALLMKGILEARLAKDESAALDSISAMTMARVFLTLTLTSETAEAITDELMTLGGKIPVKK